MRISSGWIARGNGYHKDRKVKFIRTAGLNGHKDGGNEAMTLRAYRDHLGLDRYVILKGLRTNRAEGPFIHWTGEGRFSDYRRPEFRQASTQSAASRTGQQDRSRRSPHF